MVIALILHQTLDPLLLYSGFSIIGKLQLEKHLTYLINCHYRKVAIRKTYIFDKFSKNRTGSK